MKREWLAAVILVLTVFVSAGARASQSVPAKITDVTLFFDSARVSRQAAVKVDSGTRRIVIPLEVFAIDSNSVSAAVAGQGKILGVRTTKIPVSESPQAIIRELEAQLDQLEDKKQALQDQVHVLSQQEEFLKGVVDFSKSQIPEEMKTQMPEPADLDATLAFVGKQLSRVFDERRAARNRLADLDEEIEKIRRELGMRRSRQDKTATGIEILFHAKKAQTIDITARYMVPNAGWSPVYRAYAKDAESGIDLSMMAQIRQKTGEDWQDVNLSVSTMVPVRGGRLPELSTWHLDTPRPRARKSAADRAGHMEQLAARPAAEAESAPMAEAKRQKTAISFEYTLPMTVSVPSRDEKTLLPLYTKSITGDFYYHAVPKQDPHAYLVCAAEADSELLAGPVSIFFAGRYVGEMFLEEKQPGEAFVLGLGADRAVSVKREKLRDKRKETAFFGQIERDAVVRDIAYRITAENLKDRPVKLRVTDHIPVSRTDRIKVEDVDFSPKPEKQDINGKPGVMQWRLALDPNESARIEISFTVAYPKEMPPPVF